MRISDCFTASATLNVPMLLTAVVMGLPGGVVTGQSVALAACGYAYGGSDPDSAKGKTSARDEDAYRVQIRKDSALVYSPNCRTAWARQTGGLGWLSAVLVESYYVDGIRRMVQTSRTTGGRWSRMVNDANRSAGVRLYQDNTTYDQWINSAMSSLARGVLIRRTQTPAYGIPSANLARRSRRPRSRRW